MDDSEKLFIESVRPAPGDSPERLGLKLAVVACVWEPAAEHAAIADELISLGADVHVRNDNGCTALLNAAAAGNASLVAKLLEKGADPNAADNRDEQLGPAICHAAHKQSAETIRLLIKAGANPDAQEKPGGRSALILAIDYTEEAYKGATPDCVKALIEGGANPDLATRKGWTPLLYCFARDMPETAKYLLQNGADPELKTAIDTPYATAKRSFPDVAEFILHVIAQKREDERLAQAEREKFDDWTNTGCPTSSTTTVMPRLKLLRPKV